MTNSEGCTLDRPGTEIQRRAPLISTPMTKVAASSSTLPQNTSSASRRTWRGEAQRDASISISAIGRKTNWRLAKMKESAPMRSAAGGEAASVSMTPKAMIARMAPSDQRSTVHHHWPIDAPVVARNLDHAALPKTLRARQGARHGAERIAAMLVALPLVPRGAGRRQQHHGAPLGRLALRARRARRRAPTAGRRSG